MNTRTRKLAISALVVVAPVLILLSYLLTRGDTPDPMPSHWDLHGRVNGTADPTSLFLGFLIAATLLAVAEVLIVWLVKTSTELMPAVLCYVAWVLGLSYAQIPLVSRGAASASAVALPWYTIIATVVIPIVPAVLTWRLAARQPSPAVRAAATTVRLGSNERVVWLGRAHSTALRMLAALGLLAAAALALVQPWWSLAVGLGALLLEGVSTLSVRVDGSGLHTLWGPVGWPRTVVQLDDIVSVGSQEIDPMRWGGWGYRIGRHGVAAVVRRGPGLVVERRDHPTYAVTVDGADQAADVLNAMLSRQAAESSGPSGR